MRRRPNPNLAKINRSYSVDEVSKLYGVHKNTVRNWVKKGLSTCDDLKPMLILGRDLRGYLQSIRANKKQKCKAGEMYCLKCKSPQKPAGNMVDYLPMSNTTGRLLGICTGCGGFINKYTSLAKLEQNQDKYDISLPMAQKTNILRKKVSI